MKESGRSDSPQTQMLFCIVALSAMSRVVTKPALPSPPPQLIPILMGRSFNCRSPGVKSSGWMCRQGMLPMAEQGEYFWPRERTDPGSLPSQHNPGQGKRTGAKQRGMGSLDSSRWGRRNVLSQTRPWDPRPNPFGKLVWYVSQCSNNIVRFSD